MGADNVIVCYGLRFSLGLDSQVSDSALEALERGSDPRLIAARREGLKAYSGRVTDGGEYFLLIGTILGTFGVEGRDRLEMADSVFLDLARSTRERLARAGLEGTPGLHVQLEAQY